MTRKCTTDDKDSHQRGMGNVLDINQHTVLLCLQLVLLDQQTYKLGVVLLDFFSKVVQNNLRKELLKLFIPLSLVNNYLKCVDVVFGQNILINIFRGDTK